jgi:hypothetical protein
MEGNPMRARERGFALMEWVTVLAIVAVGACLLVPAVERSRSMARQASCVDNLKMLGLAMHNYHSANDVLPMSMVVGPGHGLGHSNLTAALPYVDQTNVYNAYNFNLENWHEANATAVGTTIDAYVCPFNKEAPTRPASELVGIDGKPIPGSSKFAPAHYGANWGGGRGEWGADFVKAHGTYRGVIMTVIDKDGKDKAHNVSFAEITDGTSNTVMLVEKRDSFGWAVGGWSGSEFDVGPSPAYEGTDKKTRRVYTGSPHADGPYALMCDGAVRLLPAQEDRKVWYALITRNGNEPIDPNGN